MGIGLVAAGGPHQQHDRPVGLVLSEPLFSGMALCSAGAHVGRVGMYSCMVGLYSSRSDHKKSIMYRHAVVSTPPRAATSSMRDRKPKRCGPSSIIMALFNTSIISTSINIFIRCVRSFTWVGMTSSPYSRSGVWLSFRSASCGCLWQDVPELH